MSEQIFMFDGQDEQMLKAYESARKSFKYFWRELSWERRRIVPGLDLAIIKLPFTDGKRTDGNPEVEYMWCNNIVFDGLKLSAHLMNSPNWLTSVKEGDTVDVPFSHLTDWLMAVDGKAYGGYTVNSMRATMNHKERMEHDNAWGLDFGDPDKIRIEITRESKKSGSFFSRLFKPDSNIISGNTGSDEFNDHPMCINMLPKIESQLKENASIANTVDDRGMTILQTEALAGNFAIVQLLVQFGADITAKTSDGRDAEQIAQSIGWTHIAQYLKAQKK